MKKVAIYCRVSTGKQDLSMQINDLRSYSKQRRFEIYREYCDVASGSLAKRPALDELMADAKKRKFDAVLVWRFDRFARSTHHLVTALLEFRSLSTDFISYQENIDTSSPLGEAVFTIVSCVSQLERDIIRERVRHGVKNAREKGKQLGRPKKSYDESQLRTLRASGLSYKKIGERVGLSEGLVHRLLNQSS